MQVIDRFVSGKDGSTLEVATSASEGKEPFLLVKKKKGPILHPEVRK